MSPEAPRRRRVAVRGRRARREWRPKGRRTCQAGQAARAGRRMTSCRYCPEGNTASTLPHMRSHACRPLPVADVWWSAQASALCPSWLELGSAMMSTILEPDAPPAAVEAELLIMARHFYHRGACIDGQDILREMALGRMGTWAQEVRTAPPHSLTHPPPPPPPAARAAHLTAASLCRSFNAQGRKLSMRAPTGQQGFSARSFPDGTDYGQCSSSAHNSPGFDSGCA